MTQLYFNVKNRKKLSIIQQITNPPLSNTTIHVWGVVGGANSPSLFTHVSYLLDLLFLGLLITIKKHRQLQKM